MTIQHHRAAIDLAFAMYTIQSLANKSPISLPVLSKDEVLVNQIFTAYLGDTTSCLLCFGIQLTLRLPQ